MIIERVLSYVLPGYTLDMLREQMERFKVASPSTIFRMQRMLDCAYCLHWRRRWSELHASNTTSIYLMAESSPQFKQDWFLQIVRICTDIRLVNNARMDIIAMHCTGLPDWSADEWRDWVLDLGPHELSCLRAYMLFLWTLERGRVLGASWIRWWPSCPPKARSGCWPRCRSPWKS